jgi:hypothetical protein
MQTKSNKKRLKHPDRHLLCLSVHLKCQRAAALEARVERFWTHQDCCHQAVDLYRFGRDVLGISECAESGVKTLV